MLFFPGHVAATPGALAALQEHGIDPVSLLSRHVNGDWGSVDAEDAATNTAAVSQRSRILSAYPLDPSKPCEGFGANTVWIITEADRSLTTILLPEEY